VTSVLLQGAVGRLALACFGIIVAMALAANAMQGQSLPVPQVLAEELPPGGAWKDPAWGDPPDRAFRRHRIVGHEHAPNIDVSVPLAEHVGGRFRFRTNNLGLRRDWKTSIGKDSDMFRVLVLGDSQVDGYVDNAENLSSLLEASLSGQFTAVGRRLEVLNGAVAGYSPSQEFLWYGVNGAELEPDVVLLVFYPGNDALDVLDPTKPDVDLATGRVLRPREESPIRELGELAEATGYSSETLIEVLRTCHGCYLQSLQQAARARRDPQVMRDAVARAAATLSLLDRQVRGNGGSFVTAVLPTRAQVEPGLAHPLQQAVAALLGLDEADLAYDDEVANAILGQLGAAGVATLDLRGALSAAAWRDPLYYSRDWHLNPLGHEVAAAELAWGLAQLGLLP
jgi:lysophospholipase L1-like esterase